MKTILINPPQNTQYPQPPPGLASIAAVLEQKGRQGEIIDVNALHLYERVNRIMLRYNTEKSETVERESNMLAGNDFDKIVIRPMRMLVKKKVGGTLSKKERQQRGSQKWLIWEEYQNNFKGE